MRLLKHSMTAATVVTCGLLSLASGSAQADLTTTNLFIHLDAGLQTYVNPAKRDSVPGIDAVDGDVVWEWWDQATADGNQIGQHAGDGTIRPFYKANAVNGLPAISQYTDLDGKKHSGLLIRSELDGTDSFNTAFPDGNEAITYTMVYKKNLDTQHMHVLGAGRTGDDTFMGTYFDDNGTRTTYLDIGSTDVTITNPDTTAGTWHVITVKWDGATMSEYFDGQFTGSVAADYESDTEGVFDLRQFRTGVSSSNSSSTRFDGEYAELLVYNVALSDSDRIATEQALMAKYALLQHPGDANGDGMVNLADLQILGDNWQSTTATWAEADFTGDGNVNLADLQIIGDNWGFGTSPDVSFDEALAQVSIPEPASLALLGMGAVALLRRRVNR